MSRIVVLGSGGIGRGTAALLASRGHDVVVGCRSGVVADAAGLTAVAVDATDPDAVTRLATGADALVNALNPASYAHWDRDWPPMAHAVLTAAERSGAGLVTVSNLYGYGHVDGPIGPDTPLRPAGTKGTVRAEMWREALEAHRAGRVRATELRASDYFGAASRSGVSYLTSYVIAPATRRGTVRLVMGDADAPHSWTYLPDIAATAAALATNERSWGSAWLVPNAQPRSVRQVVADVAACLGREIPEVAPYPWWVRAALRAVPTIRALDETRHQFERPFVVDSSHTEATFDLQATDWSTAVRDTVDGVLQAEGIR